MEKIYWHLELGSDCIFVRRLLKPAMGVKFGASRRVQV